MSDPKIFTGKEYTFTLYDSAVRPGVIVRHKAAPLDHGQWVSLNDLLAFVAWRGGLPQAHTTGGCDHNMIAVAPDGSEMCRLCRASRVSRRHPWRLDMPAFKPTPEPDRYGSMGAKRSPEEAQKQPELGDPPRARSLAEVCPACGAGVGLACVSAVDGGPYRGRHLIG